MPAPGSPRTSEAREVRPPSCVAGEQRWKSPYGHALSPGRGGTGRYMIPAMTTLADLPIWTLLTRPSLNALRCLDRSMPAVISVASGLDTISLANVPLLATTRSMIKRALALGGLTLTATGALSRADVRAIFDAMNWPGYDKAKVLSMNKVLNEADVMPVELTRLIAQTAKLLRKRENRMLATKAGSALVEPDEADELFACLFATTFWQVNLAYFDRVPFETWPQNHVGIVLWCLSVAGQDWFRPEDLMRSCTVWDPALDEGPTDFPGYAFESRVLRPLTWLGLMDVCLTGDEGEPAWRRERQYRKAALFDRAVRFDVEMVKLPGRAH